LVEVIFVVNDLATAYIMQLRGIRSFGISDENWNKLLRKVCEGKDGSLIKEIADELTEEHVKAEKLKCNEERFLHENE